VARGLSQRAHNKVLDAAVELFANRGIEKTSVDAIATASGVSKATIYKHWSDKDALCLEVLAHVRGLNEGPPEQDSGDLKADLKAYLMYEPPKENAEIRKRLIPQLLAYSVQNEQFGRAWKMQVMDRARTDLKKLLRRGIDRGIFSALLDVDLSIGLILGPMMYRHIFGPGIDQTWLADGTVESFWKACARKREADLAETRLRAGKKRSRQK
jgi:AcrR family transcriptional regulator